MTEYFPDGLEVVSNWRVIALTNLMQPNRKVAIAPQEFVLTTAICMVEVKCFSARPTWNQAGWVMALLANQDGSNRAIVERVSLSLLEASILVLPKTSGKYYLQVSFCRWLPQVRLTVKEFTGEDLRMPEQLDRIQAQLEGL